MTTRAAITLVPCCRIPTTSWAEKKATAIRRDQTPDRANAAVVEWDEKFQLVKVNPLAAWSSRDVEEHVRAHDVPTNPLHAQGYGSIGCAPGTTPTITATRIVNATT